VISSIHLNDPVFLGIMPNLHVPHHDRCIDFNQELH